MPIKEVSMRKADNGYIVSWWDSPEKMKGQPEACCGMGENKTEVFNDVGAASDRLEELMGAEKD
jgi:hypothetical protein